MCVFNLQIRNFTHFSQSHAAQEKERVIIVVKGIKREYFTHFSQSHAAQVKERVIIVVKGIKREYIT